MSARELLGQTGSPSSFAWRLWAAMGLEGADRMLVLARVSRYKRCWCKRKSPSANARRLSEADQNSRFFLLSLMMQMQERRLV